MNAAKTIINSSGERLEHVYLEGERTDILVILGHGVTGNMDRPNLVSLAEALAQQGWPSLRFSFSGNGGSEGCFEDSCISKGVSDLEAVMEAYAQGRQVIYLGHSMGGAVGVMHAAKHQAFAGLGSLAGMVFTAQFCDTEFGSETPGEGCMWEDPSCPLSQSFVDDLHQIGDTLASARKVKGPWLLVHGSEDDVVPLHDSETAREVTEANTDFVVIDGADHVFSKHHDELADQVLRWMDRHFA